MMCVTSSRVTRSLQNPERTEPRASYNLQYDSGPAAPKQSLAQRPYYASIIAAGPAQTRRLTHQHSTRRDGSAVGGPIEYECLTFTCDKKGVPSYIKCDLPPGFVKLYECSKCHEALYCSKE